MFKDLLPYVIWIHKLHLMSLLSVMCLTFTMLLLTIRNGDTVGFASSGLAFIPCSVKITVAIKNLKSWERRTAL